MFGVLVFPTVCGSCVSCHVVWNTQWKLLEDNYASNFPARNYPWQSTLVFGDWLETSASFERQLSLWYDFSVNKPCARGRLISYISTSQSAPFGRNILCGFFLGFFHPLHGVAGLSLHLEMKTRHVCGKASPLSVNEPHLYNEIEGLGYRNQVSQQNTWKSCIQETRLMLEVVSWVIGIFLLTSAQFGHWYSWFGR